MKSSTKTSSRTKVAACRTFDALVSGRFIFQRPGHGDISQGSVATYLRCGSYRSIATFVGSVQWKDFWSDGQECSVSFLSDTGCTYIFDESVQTTSSGRALGNWAGVYIIHLDGRTVSVVCSGEICHELWRFPKHCTTPTQLLIFREQSTGHSTIRPAQRRGSVGTERDDDDRLQRYLQRLQSPGRLSICRAASHREAVSVRRRCSTTCGPTRESGSDVPTPTPECPSPRRWRLVDYSGRCWRRRQTAV